MILSTTTVLILVAETNAVGNYHDISRATYTTTSFKSVANNSNRMYIYYLQLQYNVWTGTTRYVSV